MKNLFLGIFLLVFLTGCSPEIWKVVASEKNMPSNILEIKKDPSESPNIDSLVIKVTNAEQLTEAWDYFSMEKKTPKADFDTYDYYFVSIRESSSCPYKLKDVTVNDSNEEINFYFRQKAGSCNSDATPRTVLVEVEKNDAIRLENASIIYHSGNRETRTTEIIRGIE
ncbi:hypothetical protein RGU12_19920 [Fredinandcohnia sp. QZ13]|uniref:hypothetical protein n=1 Tax=Fredinandcohnia sp. QZ13 TaxID=3073144 RepID=UPI002852F483|nr:hypothetical protein [Fredinandcohnia sp. QZ13]MDR4889765.1 hypothetical protein [Fredinandcohnia sp. QZ13]